jgi:RNA polymerase sigma-70 factor (ECF subfamily)
MCADEAADPEQLLARARQDRGEHLGVLLNLYRNYLRLLAQTQIDLHLHGRVDPSDLVQETMLEAFRDFGQFRGGTEAELLAWLRRILLHNLAGLVEKHLKAKKRDARREVPLHRLVAEMEESSEKIDAALVSRGTSAGTRNRRREQVALLADQLARMKADYREVIVLRNLEGLAFEEVARRMGRSTGAVRMLWLRALDRLKQLLEQEDLI